MVKPVTLKKVSDVAVYNSLPAFLTYFKEYGTRSQLEEVFFKIRNKLSSGPIGRATGSSEISEKDIPELIIFTNPKAAPKTSKPEKKSVEEVIPEQIVLEVIPPEEFTTGLSPSEEESMKEVLEEQKEKSKSLKVVKPEVKPIQVNESRQLKSPDEILEDPENKTIIAKIGALYKAGYSPEFISKYGQEKGVLKKNYTPKEVEWQLKNKGFIHKEK